MKATIEKYLSVQSSAFREGYECGYNDAPNDSQEKIRLLERTITYLQGELQKKNARRRVKNDTN